MVLPGILRGSMSMRWRKRRLDWRFIVMTTRRERRWLTKRRVGRIWTGIDIYIIIVMPTVMMATLVMTRRQMIMPAFNRFIITGMFF